MMNLKKTIFLSIATGAGAALSFSFASLFASSEAHAFSIIRENGDTGAVTRIEGLSVEVEGVATLYDVSLLGGSAVDVYGDTFDFMTSDFAEAAAAAVIEALGEDEWTGIRSGLKRDGVHVGYG
ncbi:MAG: hypothetical protein F6K24_40460, partial [Okeania sp. SIO2D1]|nr:hypothetical protein [Okeania sp. SIO2D1]